MLEEKKMEWEQIRAKGFLSWWISDGVKKFLLPVFIINVFFVNPIIMNLGIRYFYSQKFIKSTIINAVFLIILSLLKALLTWYFIDKEYRCKSDIIICSTYTRELKIKKNLKKRLESVLVKYFNY